MKLVRVAPGYSEVPLLGRLWNQGQLISLNDSQYQALPTFIRGQLMVISSGPDVAGPAHQTSYTDQLTNTELSRLGVPIFLVWDGTDYQPSKLKTAVDRPKTFIGPVDPSTAGGAILAPRDQWINH